MLVLEMQSSTCLLSLQLTCLAQTQDIAADLEAAFAAQSLTIPLHKLGACKDSSSTQLSLPPAGDSPQVVLVCGPQHDVAGSMRLLSDVGELVRASGRSHAFIFAGRPQVRHDTTQML